VELARPLEAAPAEKSPALTALRLQRKLTIEQAAKRSALWPEQVEWLEEGRLYRFPGYEAAVMALLRYATALGIDHREARKLSGMPVEPPAPRALGRWIAAGAKDDTPAEARETAPLDKPPVYHLPPVITGLAYSPDGKILAVSGYREVLLHDAQLTAQRLATAGVPVEVQVWPGQIHVFHLAAPMIPEATRSLRQIGRYIREATG